jgi:hypothetical protein
MPNFQHPIEEMTFLESIDCQFPYHDHARAIAVVEEACSISPNAAFAVVDEISRLRLDKPISVEFSTTLLALIEQRLSHSLVKPIIRIAQKLVLNQPVSVTESVLVMREVERFPGQYSALSVGYFACDDVDGIADTEFNRIKAVWEGVS